MYYENLECLHNFNQKTGKECLLIIWDELIECQRQINP